MIEKNHTIWERDYKENTPVQAPPIFNSPLTAFLARSQRPRRQQRDEFLTYVEAEPLDMVEWNHTNLFS